MKQNRFKFSLVTLLFALGLLIFGGNALADNTQMFEDAYQTGQTMGVMKDSKADFIKLCQTQIYPDYLGIKSYDPTITFAQYAAETVYYQDQSDSQTQHVTADDFIDANNQQNQQNINPYLTTLIGFRKGKVKIKKGDILICNSKTFPDKFIGHAAIATSSKYVLEMPGKTKKTKSLKKNTRHYPISQFIKDHTKRKGWVCVWRIKKHPRYANTAASYAWNRMYRNGKLDYGITLNLYKKNPTYCSKYVYQAYWYGNHGKGMNKKWGIVHPYSVRSWFKGSYRPQIVYKVTYY